MLNNKHANQTLKKTEEEIFLAGGCLWGVQEFVRHLPGVLFTEAGRANGRSQSLGEPYDGYVECVRVRFNPEITTVDKLIESLFEIIDPYSLNKQGPDSGERYRTGVYSKQPTHLKAARKFIEARSDASRIVTEVLPLSNYLRSADEHQDRLNRFPDDPCHIPKDLLFKYRDHSH